MTKSVIYSRQSVFWTVLLVICCSSFRSAEAHGEDPLMGVVMSVPFSYDSQAKHIATGVDINLALLLLNAGIEYRDWGHEIRGWDNSKVRSEIVYYVGTGFGGLLQTQAGFSGTGTVLRIRSDLVLFGENSPAFGTIGNNRWLIFRKGIVLSPFWEISPWSRNRKNVYGLGIGVHF